MSANSYETAIIFLIDKPGEPLKYRNIKSRKSFETWLQKAWPNAHYINYYNKTTKAYQGRTWIQ